MATVIKAKRRSAVLTPSSLACLSTLPTINLTAGCLHDCVYCYIRAYRNYPGEGRIVLYENTLEKLREELRNGANRPRAVYFSPSSDLFQPAPEVLDLARAVLTFLLQQGIGVAFLTKGLIPDETLRLLVEHRELVRAQVGIISLREEVASTFEPHAASPRDRLWQLASLIDGGIAAEARLDPILPGLTDGEAELDRSFAALAQVGVERAAAGVLFLRPGILYWLKRSVRETRLLEPLLATYDRPEEAFMRGSPWPIRSAPVEIRAAIFDRVRAAAQAHGVELRVCACKNADIAKGSCNIAGTWPSLPASSAQPVLTG